MYIKQISVFLENTAGRLSQFAKTLADNKIDIRALCIADTVDFGILRCIVSDPEKATEVLKENNFNASITEVLAVEMEDIPGGLHKVLEVLDGAEISVDYVYSIIKSKENHGVIILKVKDPKKAVAVLENAGITMYGEKDLI